MTVFDLGGRLVQCAIRPMAQGDRQEVLLMMREFYSSSAVFTDGSDEIFEADIANCIGDNPYIEGYVFEMAEGICGYAMVAKSYSTEFGKPCIWIEDIFVKNAHRGAGVGSLFLGYIESKYPNSVFRLEVEEENERAVGVYKKCGYGVLPYMEMKKEP